MDEKIENKNEKKSKKKRVLILVILLLFLLIPGVIFWIINNREKNSSPTDSGVETESVENAGENKKSSDENTAGNVDKELVNENDIAAEKEMVSENYRVSQVRFGGNATVIDNGKSRNTSLEIYQVKSENIISQEDNEPRILISWKTNKEAISTVEYAKGDGKDAATATEEGYGFEHSMLIKNMEFSTIYTYRIESMDKWGNRINTEYFSAYTGDKSESIFDLITNAIEDVFGWAM